MRFGCLMRSNGTYLVFYYYCLFVFIRFTDKYIYIFSIVMEPITLFAIYTFGLIIGGVGLGYYLESRSKDYYQKLQQYVDDNFRLHF